MGRQNDDTAPGLIFFKKLWLKIMVSPVFLYGFNIQKIHGQRPT
jgi:hypothetical protein